ncbi:putative splicing factor 3B subunit 3 [Diplonema papillatum]|nr:putative splicing factor 3B subunit 3 [Diplonema papillatum]
MSLSLYNLTLEKGGAIQCCCYGSFSAAKQHEMVCGRGPYLELLRFDAATAQLKSISMTHAFGTLRAIAPFRLYGASRDYLMVTSDSGRIVILEFDALKREWIKVHQETYGKSGVRRAVPGQYLATDPRGRAVMLGAISKQKFVYILNRDSDAKITISSPLEAHKTFTLTYSLIGLDVGFDNPVFAAIEVDHEESDEDPQAPDAEKHLVYYELDLGLNHVIRKSPWAEEALDTTASMLLAVPGGESGPGGVLVCSDNYLTYMNPGHDIIREVIPRRQDMLPTNGLMVTCASLHKRSDRYFFLVQSEYGDLYKVTLSVSARKDTVNQINIQYFDTVPVANSIHILKNGFFFVASEFANHKFYQFKSTEQEDDSVIGAMTVTQSSGKREIFPLFNPRPLRNLQPITDIESLSPLIDLKVGDPSADSEAKRLFALCGRGPQSSIRVLQHGLSLGELGTAHLDGAPDKVWTIKRKFAADLHDYIVLSFPKMTLVLSVGDTVEAVHDSGFLRDASTLVCRTMLDDSLLQVHSAGIRHIRKNRLINEWKAPGKRTIVAAEANEKQVVITLGAGELLYFELDQGTSMLNEVCKKDLDREVACLAIGPIPEGRIRSRFLAVGFRDRRVLLLNLDPGENMGTLARQSCSSEPHGICIVSMDTEIAGSEQELCMYIGCVNGVVVRSVLDRTSGEITDARTRFCGVKPCQLVPTQSGGKTAVLVLSSRSWLGYFHQNKYHHSPLASKPFDHASFLSSEQCPEGFVAVTGSTVSILALERVGDCFNQTTFPLKATPRGFVKHPHYPHLIIIETEHRAYTDEEKQGIRDKLRASIAQEGDVPEQEEDLPEKDYGTIKAAQGKWCSYIRVWDTEQMVTHDLIELEENQAAVSIATCTFHDTGGEVHLVVGTVKDFIPNPNCYSSGLLLTFRLREEGKELDLVHKTIIDGIPKALHPFQGRLLVGVNNKVRIYDLGKMKLLRKCENRQVPNMVVKLTSQGDRIFAGDITDSVHLLKYSKQNNKLSVFADDSLPRWTTALVTLDRRTVAVGDKLGNINVVRLDEHASEDLDNDPNCDTGSSKWLYDRGFLQGAPQRLQLVASYHVGSTVTSMERTTLVTGGEEIILYSTISGSVGCLIPIRKKHDSEMLKLLEMHIRQESPPLCGRDHLAYRSYYTPQKAVVDGDFVETFSTLPYSIQTQIAGDLRKTPNEVIKRLEEIRNKVL